MVSQLRRVRRKVPVQKIRNRGFAGHRRLLPQHRGLIDVLVVEALDLLWLPILQNRKVAGLQPLHHLACLLVPYHHIRQHNVGLHLQRERAVGACCCASPGEPAITPTKIAAINRRIIPRTSKLITRNSSP